MKAKLCLDCNAKLKETAQQCPRCHSTNLKDIVIRDRQPQGNGGAQPQRSQAPRQPMQDNGFGNQNGFDGQNGFNGQGGQNGFNGQGGFNNEANGNNQGFNTPQAAEVKGGADVITLGQWLLIFIQLIIPIWNIIFIIKTLVSSTENPTKKNYIKATLIMYVIAIVLSIGLSSVVAGALLSAM